MFIEKDYYHLNEVLSIKRICVGDDGRSCWNKIYATVVTLKDGKRYEYFLSNKEESDNHNEILKQLQTVMKEINSK